MTFQKAERKQARPKLALTGPSGSGKTFSALLIASGMGKKIAVIDTENGSASLYADMDKGPLKGVTFDVLEVDPPYTIDKYVKAIQAAQSEGYDVLIIDSISHAWAGEGGLLSKKESLDQRGGNSYTNWAGISKEHEQFKARILNADIVMICTMRSKQDYVLEVNEKGKSSPKKVGMAPIQRDGMEYEFTTVFDLAMDHNAAASKDRTSLFDGQLFKPTCKTGEQIMAWLAGGKPIEPKVVAKPAPQPAAQPSAGPVEAAPTEPFPDEPAEGDIPAGAPEDPAATEDQLKAISAHIADLKKLGKDDSLIFTEIYRKAGEKGPQIVELSELSFAAADHVSLHLGNWIEHIKSARAKKNGRAA